MEPTTQSQDEAAPAPVGYLPVKNGHPRWNVAILLVLIAVVLAIALIEAERLSLGS